MASITVDGVVKRYGGRAGNPAAALDGVSLDAREGELLALLGPSGSGKTTLLRAIAGLETIEGGRILLDGEDATGIPARERRIGFVFQHYALFRHMTVSENVAFGLRARPRGQRPPEREIADRVTRLLEMVQLGAFARRRPAALSGGQRQRVALARALAIEPRVLLLDEPFGALDAKVRRDLRRWLRELHDRLGLTTLFVAEFLGDAVRVPVSAGFLRHVGGSRDTAVVLVRPHDVEVATAPGAPGAPGVPATVRRAISRGGARLLELELDDGSRLEAEVARSHGPADAPSPGAKVLVHARVAHSFGEGARGRVPTTGPPAVTGPGALRSAG